MGGIYEAMAINACQDIFRIISLNFNQAVICALAPVEFDGAYSNTVLEELIGDFVAVNPSLQPDLAAVVICPIEYAAAGPLRADYAMFTASHFVSHAGENARNRPPLVVFRVCEVEHRCASVQIRKPPELIECDNTQRIAGQCAHFVVISAGL